ncbi:MAG: alpha/beta fold hydrolase [Actinomycetota bacterium]
MSIELPPLQTIDLDGPIAFREWEGPEDTTFVLVHGLGGMQVNWVSVAPGLAGLGRVVALDLPGFGASPLEGRDAGIMGLRRSLDGFIAALATGRTVVVGNSMGGAVGILEAAIAPERVDGLVLTSPALPRVGHALMHPSLALGLALYDVPALGEALTTARVRTVDAERLVRLGFRFTCARPEEIPEDVVELHVESVGAHQPMAGGVEAFGAASSSLLRLARRPDVSARALDGVRCPVLLLHGRLDRLIPARYAEEVLRRYPAWRGRLFPGVGHVAMLEVPGRWISEVAEWFSGTYERSSGVSGAPPA